MVLKRSAVLVCTLLAGIIPTQARSETARGVFQEWLTAFNSRDKGAIQAFYGTRLGDPTAAFARDSAEDTCGFDMVRVELQTETAMSVLLAEKCFPALQQLNIELGAPADKKLKAFSLKSIALPQSAAITAIEGMADRLSTQDKFAGSLLIVQGGEQRLARSWGTLDRMDLTPITLDTPMFLASAGKMFTAISVLQLVDAGKIDLDAPLDRYLINYPNAEMARVTIRQLLQHRGGAGDVGILARGEGSNRAHVKTIDQIIALNGNRAPAFPPGSKAEYSNYGFLLLDAIVEQVTGKTYYDYVIDNVFKPAGMSKANFPDLDHLQGVATGFTTFYGQETALVSNRQILPWRGIPAGGGVASANDILRFFGALRSGKLLSASMLKLATTAGDTPWYGMGFVVNSGKFTSFGHGGNSYGMDVAAHFYPSVDTTFVCLATRDMACNRLIQAWYHRVLGL